MLVIDASGNSPYLPNTKTPQQSSHPVWEARIELALGQGEWLYAPSYGHDLNKYRNLKATPANVNQFQKDLIFYLEKYGSQVTALLLQRGAVSLTLAIDQSVIDQTLTAGGANA